MSVKEIKTMLTQIKESIENATKKPLGIILIIAYFAWGAKGNYEIYNLFSTIGSMSIWLLLLSYIFLIMAIIDIMSIYGLWTFQLWGRSLAIVNILLSIPLGYYALVVLSQMQQNFLPGRSETPSYVLLILIDIVIIIMILRYLFKKEVKILYDKKVDLETEN